MSAASTRPSMHGIKQLKKSVSCMDISQGTELFLSFGSHISIWQLLGLSAEGYTTGHITTNCSCLRTPKLPPKRHELGHKGCDPGGLLQNRETGNPRKWLGFPVSLFGSRPPGLQHKGSRDKPSRHCCLAQEGPILSNLLQDVDCQGVILQTPPHETGQQQAIKSRQMQGCERPLRQTNRAGLAIASTRNRTLKTRDPKDEAILDPPGTWPRKSMINMSRMPMSRHFNGLFGHFTCPWGYLGGGGAHLGFRGFGAL